jgi:hypothetical protein
MATIGSRVIALVAAAASLAALSGCVEASVPARTVYVEAGRTVYVEGGRTVIVEPVQPTSVRRD